jgi:hypothetical protein
MKRRDMIKPIPLIIDAHAAQVASKLDTVQRPGSRAWHRQSHDLADTVSHLQNISMSRHF